MSETFVPESNSTQPNELSLLDIVKAFRSTNNQEFPVRFLNINQLLSPVIQPNFENIQNSPYTNVELNTILTGLTQQTLVNTRDIIYTKHLVALLTFELIEQGIDIENKELLQNIKTYLKIN